MTDICKSLAQLQTVDFVANAGTEAIGSQQFRNGALSAFSCYGAIRNSFVDQTITLGSSGIWTEFGSGGGGTCWSDASAVNTLTASATTGRITCATVSGGSAGGKYLVWYFLRFSRGTVAVPEAIACTLRVNGVTAGAGTDYASDLCPVVPKSAVQYDYLQVPTIISATGSYYVPAPKAAWTAESLVLTTATDVTGATDKYTGIQVVNYGTDGATGTNTDLFSTAKSTDGDAITAKIPKVWTFNQNTSIAAGSQLELNVTKGGSAAAIQSAVIRGYRTGEAASYGGTENRHTLHGMDMINLTPGDYFSLGGYAAAGGTIVVHNGFMAWRRVGGN